MLYLPGKEHLKRFTACKGSLPAALPSTEADVYFRLDLTRTLFPHEPQRNSRSYSEMKKDVTDITDDGELQDKTAALVGDL